MRTRPLMRTHVFDFCELIARSLFVSSSPQPRHFYSSSPSSRGRLAGAPPLFFQACYKRSSAARESHSPRARVFVARHLTVYLFARAAVYPLSRKTANRRAPPSLSLSFSIAHALSSLIAAIEVTPCIMHTGLTRKRWRGNASSEERKGREREREKQSDRYKGGVALRRTGVAI